MNGLCNSTTLPAAAGARLNATAAAAAAVLQRAQKAAAKMKQPCEMVLIRHGETDWNKERRIQGQEQPGPGLNRMGWQQAQLVTNS
jgi:hypothetical protein